MDIVEKVGHACLTSHFMQSGPQGDSNSSLHSDRHGWSLRIEVSGTNPNCLFDRTISSLTPAEPWARCRRNLGPEIIRLAGVLGEFPALDDLTVAEDEGDGGRDIQGFSVAFGMRLLESYSVVLSANDVQDTGLK